MTDEKLPGYTRSSLSWCLQRFRSPALGEHVFVRADMDDLRAVLDAMTPEQLEAVIPEFWRGAVAGERLQRARAESAERERDELREKLRAAEAELAGLATLRDRERREAVGKPHAAEPADYAALATACKEIDDALGRDNSIGAWERAYRQKPARCPELCPPRITEEEQPDVPAATDEAHPATVAAVLTEIADWYEDGAAGIPALRNRAAEWRAKGGSR
jgi:hypothetical protein